MIRKSILAAESFVTLAWMRALLRVAPHRALRGVLAERTWSKPVDSEVVRVFQRVSAKTPIAHTCMHRSLALQRILGRRGTATQLRIGIGRRPNLFPGHAWLEADGEIINDQAEQITKFVPLTISESALVASYR